MTAPESGGIAGVVGRVASGIADEAFEKLPVTRSAEEGEPFRSERVSGVLSVPEGACDFDDKDSLVLPCGYLYKAIVLPCRRHILGDKRVKDSPPELWIQITERAPLGCAEVGAMGDDAQDERRRDGRCEKCALRERVKGIAEG